MTRLLREILDLGFYVADFVLSVPFMLVGFFASMAWHACRYGWRTYLKILAGGFK